VDSTWQQGGLETMEAQELWEAINFYPKLSLEHGDSHWKSLEEKKITVPREEVLR
jgi:hypothetical protein